MRAHGGATGVGNDEQDVRCLSGRPTQRPCLRTSIRGSSPWPTRTIPSPQRPSTGGQFRSDLEGYLAREALDAAIVRARSGLPPLPDVPYVAFTEQGSADSFTLALAREAWEASHAAGS